MSRGPRRSRSIGGTSVALVFVTTLLLATGAHSRGEVHASAEDVEPLAPGSTVPSVQVHSVDGSAVDLAEAIRDDAHEGALLVFYRGGW